MRNLALALGFYSISIFPAYFSVSLGAGSIRAGLILGIVFFFILAVPFGIRYFVTPKIILINIFVFIIISLFYLISTLIFPGVDHIRFLLSLALLFSISIASIYVVATLDLLNDEFFHKMILFGFYFLICTGYIVFIRKFIFGYTLKNFIFFSEASHYAIVFIPFLFYAAYTNKKNIYSVLYIIASLFLALTLQNLTLLAGCLMVFLLIYGNRAWLLGLIISMLAIVIIYLDVSYFLDRLDFSGNSMNGSTVSYFLDRLDLSGNSMNGSTLVFLSGWERAYLTFFDSFGVGFQQMGIVGPQGEFQIKLQELHKSSRGLNWNDGGTLGSKLVTEFGLLGLILLLLYCFSIFNILRNFLLRKINGSKNIFFYGVYILFSIELFVRGVGYFSLTSFMFISSMYWIYRSQILASQQQGFNHA